MDIKTFDGARLRKARKAKGLSQSRLGALIGAHVTSVSDWERGANAPSGRHIASISRELDVSVEELYGDEDDEESDQVRPVSLDEFLRLHIRQVLRDEMQAVQA